MTTLRQFERLVYLAARTQADVRAAQRGRLTQRLVHRAQYRAIWQLLRSIGL